MTNTLTEILDKLRSDSTWVIQLYEALYNSTFFVLVRPGSQQQIELMEFLIYPTEDGIRELPIFTSSGFLLDFQNVETAIVEAEGRVLWPRLLEIIEPQISEVAVNPGQNHGIRLNNSMILGMISMYGVAL